MTRLAAWLARWVGRRLDSDERDVVANVLPRQRGK